MEKLKDSRIIPLIALILATIVSLYFIINYKNECENISQQLLESEEQVEELEEIDTHSDIQRKEGYNSILLNFYNKDGQLLYMNNTLFSIYSNFEAYSSIAEALNSEAIIDYDTNNTRYSFLLKEGYKYNATMNPYSSLNIEEWEDYKANCPFEVTATPEGNNKLTIFNITVDYESPIVRSTVETLELE